MIRVMREALVASAQVAGKAASAVQWPMTQSAGCKLSVTSRLSYFFFFNRPHRTLFDLRLLVAVLSNLSTARSVSRYEDAWHDLQNSASEYISVSRMS
jgi:hypothetical protein